MSVFCFSLWQIWDQKWQEMKPVANDAKRSCQQAEKWHCNNIFNQPLQTPALISRSQTHTHTHTEKLTPKLLVFVSVCNNTSDWLFMILYPCRTRLLIPCSVACMCLCLICIHTKPKLCLCMPYPTFWPAPVPVLSSWWSGLCRFSRVPSTILSSGLSTVNPEASSRMSSTDRDKSKGLRSMIVCIQTLYLVGATSAASLARTRIRIAIKKITIDFIVLL